VFKLRFFERVTIVVNTAGHIETFPVSTTQRREIHAGDPLEVFAEDHHGTGTRG
jgi:hypothetical protein